MTHRIFPVLISVLIAGQAAPAAIAASSQPDVNFKIYSPSEPATDSRAGQRSDSAAPAADTKEVAPQAAPASGSQAAGSIEIPVGDSEPKSQPSGDATSQGVGAGAGAPPDATRAEASAADPQKIASKVLQGYIRVVPSGTKIPIIMDTAVDSDTSQEGDEFSARTAEDLTIDGGIVVPAGSVIKGRIAQLNAARRFDRSGSVALKFDTVTTPDNRQIPIVANIVARGGVVHARRGMKDLAIETGMVALPTAAGLGIGLLAGNASKSSSISGAGGALIGAGIGVAVGAIVLMAKKGKRVDVRPGDELKIELAEDLRMPM